MALHSVLAPNAHMRHIFSPCGGHQFSLVCYILLAILGRKISGFGPSLDDVMRFWKKEFPFFLHYAPTGSVLSSGESWNCYSGKKIHTETRYVSLSFITQVHFEFWDRLKSTIHFFIIQSRVTSSKLGLPVVLARRCCWLSITSTETRRSQ